MLLKAFRAKDLKFYSLETRAERGQEKVQAGEQIRSTAGRRDSFVADSFLTARGSPLFALVSLDCRLLVIRQRRFCLISLVPVGASGLKPNRSFRMKSYPTYWVRVLL